LKWIKRTVHDLTKKYNTNDPFALAEVRNIHVIPWDLHCEIKGFYKYDKRNKYIFVNNNLDDNLQKFVCAHELGHSQLHPRVNTPFLRGSTFFSVDKIEVEANTFAVELLLPDEYLLELHNSNTSIYEVTNALGIPKELAHLKSANFFTQ